MPPPGESVVGKPQHAATQFEDTLLDIARYYNLGYHEMKLANPGVDMWLPGEGTEIVLPTRFILPDAPREGIVVNVAEMRVYYYPPPRTGESARVVTYPISIGRVDWQTPLGATSVIAKAKDPAWYPPESVRREHAEAGDPLPAMVPPGPDNPLGDYALRLGLPGYLIHGTNKPYGIGMQVTHGCLRLYPEDIEALFNAAPVGTPVHIVNQPYKAGWHAGELYLEVHPPLAEVPQEGALRQGDISTAPEAARKPLNLTPMVETVMAATSDKPQYPVDWERIEAMLSRPLGMPLSIAKTAKPAIESVRISGETAVQAESVKSRRRTAVPAAQPD